MRRDRTLEWVTSVLYLRGHDTRLFTLAAPAEDRSCENAVGRHWYCPRRPPCDHYHRSEQVYGWWLDKPATGILVWLCEAYGAGVLGWVARSDRVWWVTYRSARNRWASWS